MSIRVRFPPSPTGFCHVGTARMAVLNYLFAKKHGGVIIFRSEDTDKERGTKEFELDIIDNLSWLGLSWDEFYRQSERTEIYRTAIHKLIAGGKAYVSEEESKKEPGVMIKIIRLKNPGETVTFTDTIRGDITFDTTELGDFAIARAEDDPLYHLAVVVDDGDMGITHIIRGEDHISNTPRQILIQEALGLPRPVYAHYPLHLAADRSKLSKRKGDVAVRSYREKGYLAPALLNYLATLGWTAPSGKEVLSLEEMIGEFELGDVHKSGAVFDIEKLNWYNRHYLQALPLGDFAAESNKILKTSMEARTVPWSESVATSLAPLIRERISVWEELQKHAQAGEYDFFFTDPAPEPSRIPQKGVSTGDTIRHLERVKQLLSELPEGDYADSERIKAAIWEYAGAEGRGAVLWPLRYSLTGLERSPDPFEVAHFIGKEATLRRIDAALALVSKI
ncbi:glutamate--tRNA ligase [Candidatus Kaiserbacteria bacterium]|nr:glutamate--tRNA ligase [Candidatus Kaiserbacteria bacterium]